VIEKVDGLSFAELQATGAPLWMRHTTEFARLMSSTTSLFATAGKIAVSDLLMIKLSL
jgi:hypothetical protein